VGGAHDYPNGAAYGAYLAYIAANPDSAAAYFQWNQGAALANWIDANNGEVVVYAHSWGGDTAASVVAAGHDVAALITVDPVSWTRPNFQLVATNAGIWIDYNALGGTGFSFSNLVAGVGDAWDAAPAKFATLYQTINLNHVDVMCAVAPSGCR
jgi:pimeloyl-ACP methyl ester carboxylesterase